MADSEWNKKIGNLLEGYIYRSGLQMKTVSALTGISERALKSYIYGERVPDLKNFSKLAKILAIPTDQFFHVLWMKK